jgi:hypothetical protein
MAYSIFIGAGCGVRSASRRNRLRQGSKIKKGGKSEGRRGRQSISSKNNPGAYLLGAHFGTFSSLFVSFAATVQ